MALTLGFGQQQQPEYLKTLNDYYKSIGFPPPGQSGQPTAARPAQPMGQNTQVLTVSPGPAPSASPGLGYPSPTLAAQPQQVSRSAAQEAPAGQPAPLPYDPTQASGESYNPQTGKWEFVAGGGKPQVVYYGPTDTLYYNGQPISKEQYQLLQQNGPGAAGSLFYQHPVGQTLEGMNFFQQPPPITPPTLGGGGMSFGGGGGMPQAAGVAPPTPVTAPQMAAEQGGFQDFDALQKAIFKSEYLPIRRELTRQATLAGDRLQSQLAQAGIADSGVGVQMLSRQADDFQRQMAAAATDAANRAAVQRYGLEFTQGMENAKLRQEANLANAGFSLTAQVENAKNLLTANITTAQLATQTTIAGAQIASNQAIAQAQIASSQAIAQAQMQLQAMGLNLQAEQAARSDYLKLLGIQEADLARMDAFTLQSTAMFYDTYLKQLAILSGAGQVTFSKQDQSSGGSNFNVGL